MFSFQSSDFTTCLAVLLHSRSEATGDYCEISAVLSV